MSTALFGVLSLLVGAFLALSAMGWPMLSKRKLIAARIGAVVCGIGAVIVGVILIWHVVSLKTALTVSKKTLIFWLSLVAMAVAVFLLARFIVYITRVKASRAPLHVQYISSQWIEPSRELLVEASFRCKSGVKMAIEGIELRVGRTRVPYKKLSRPTVLPLRLQMPVSEEETIAITFVIPNKLQNKNHLMRLCVTAGGKRYFSESNRLSLDSSSMLVPTCIS